MTIMLDTNIIISAALFPNGRTAEAFSKRCSLPISPLSAITSWTNCIENSGKNFLRDSQSWKPFFSMPCHLSSLYRLRKNLWMQKVKFGIRKTDQSSEQLWMPTLICFSPVIRIF